MTRVLSELLGIERLQLTQTIHNLEAGSGRQSHDIRLTTEMQQRARRKLQQLGLDPDDTTPQELYRALQQRLGRDDGLLRAKLGIAPDASAAMLDTAVGSYIGANEPTQSFALKTSVAKRLLKKLPPKHAMKKLGYRSLDSLLKHEPVAAIYAAAWLSESLAWRKRYLDQYAKLTPSDFETRAIAVCVPNQTRWQDLANELAAHGSQRIAAFADLATIVVLPTQTVAPGQTLATTALLLGARNDIASVGSYLKLQQVRPDFGQLVARASEQEPTTSAELNGEAVPWRILHQFYARLPDEASRSIFEPHMEASDLSWLPPEHVLAELHPAFEFWRDTHYCAFISEGEVVSLNLLDVALSHTAGHDFTARLRHFMSIHLWQELLLRYLDPVNVEHALAAQLSPDMPALVDETDIALY